MIQLAMPIEPGNSGGPVVDPAGRVVGIVTIKSLVTRNLGFAVGVNALKPLLEKPNPVPMARWLTIGTLDATQWTTLFGGRWQQRGGRIVVTEAGSGFGGRSLCLSLREPPPTPFELSVHVKLGDESGAAGLAFHADGGNRHYGFYPTAGKLRVTRFDGPSVFEWKVLRDMPSPHYRPGDWNRLTVRVEKGGFRCLVNGEPFATVDDDGLPPGRVGLAKFRDTNAEFKLFRMGPPVDEPRPDAAVAGRLQAAIDQLPPLERLTAAGMAPLADDAESAATAARERASMLEKRAADLRLVAADLHTTRVSGELARLCAQGEGCDLLRAALVVAQLDDEELDIDAYVQQVDRMAQEITQALPKDADEPARLAALDTYLFADNGFHGSRTDYYHRANSHLSRVIDDREGLPITLSILYMELAKRLDMNVVGVGLPGHFVVKHIPRQGDEQLIDVFEGAAPLSREDAARRVRAMADVDLEEDHLRPFPKEQIVRRVLRNLLGVAQNAKDREAMLRYLAALVAIQPDDTADRGLLAVARFETGRREAAISGLDWFLEHQPPGIDLDVIRALQDRFRKGAPPQ
jgi:regulator of sirC expression with transglutaminase-like and TPR domain